MSDKQQKNLDLDGIVKTAQNLKQGQEYFKYFDESTNHTKEKYYKEREQCQVERVYLSSDKQDTEKQYVIMRQKINRNPVVGDKFSSRHG